MATPVYPYPPPTRRESLSSRICDFVFLWLCKTILMSWTAGTLFLFGWMIYSLGIMKDPYMPQFAVESATVSQLNADGSSLTATWDIRLLARNPNNPSKLNRKYKIYFDNVFAEVRYHYIGDQVIRLGSTQLPPFALKEREDKRLNFKVEAVEEWIGDAVVQQISNDVSRGSVRFDVRLPIAVRLKAVLVPSKPYSFEVSCHVVDYGFSGNNGTGVLRSQPWCYVNNII